MESPVLPRAEIYREVLRRLDVLLEDEDDWVAAMATVACELHGAFDHFDWTGFYRDTGDGSLVIGPYQGSHGCLRIEPGRGVCGAAAESRKTVVVPDVSEFPGHIACSATTVSEIVVPVLRMDGTLLAVLDVDSDRRDAFTPEDVEALEALCRRLGERYGSSHGS